MRDSYDDSPAAAREAGLRRLGRLTWRTTQLGALATVGFAIVFARTAPAASVQTVTPAEPAKATATPSATAAHHASKPRRVVGSHPAAQQTARPAAQPSAPSATPSLAPPTTAPAPAPTTAAPAPTVSSASHGGN